MKYLTYEYEARSQFRFFPNLSTRDRFRQEIADDETTKFIVNKCTPPLTRLPCTQHGHNHHYLIVVTQTNYSTLRRRRPRVVVVVAILSLPSVFFTRLCFIFLTGRCLPRTESHFYPLYCWSIYPKMNTICKVKIVDQNEFHPSTTTTNLTILKARELLLLSTK